MGSGASTTGGSGLDGVGVRGGGRERELDARGLRYLRDGKAASAHNAPDNGIQDGRRKPPVFAWAVVVGIGGGGSMTGGSGLDGVGVRGGGREREMDSRGLRHLRDGNRLGHKATAFKRGGFRRPSSRLQTASTWAAVRARRVRTTA